MYKSKNNYYIVLGSDYESGTESESEEEVMGDDGVVRRRKKKRVKKGKMHMQLIYKLLF